VTLTTSADAGLLMVSIVAGVIGSLAGVGGGLIIIPALTIVFGVEIHLAIGASIVSVIATSSGAAAAYVRDGLSNLRVAMALELATTIGAVLGAMVASSVPAKPLEVVLGIVLLVTAAAQLLRVADRATPGSREPNALAGRLGMTGSYVGVGGVRRDYIAQRVPLGFALMGFAGVISGLLGIGSGALKVLALDGAMRLPMKVSTATSNFMIGVTAAASAGIYLGRGDVDVRIAAPVALGILTGALLGARLLPRLRDRTVRFAFMPILALIGLEMLARGLGFGL